MAPIHIKALLEIFAFPLKEQLDAAADTSRVGELFNNGLVKNKDRSEEDEDVRTEGEHNYEVTARGVAYVEALCALPLPEQIWRIPS